MTESELKKQILLYLGYQQKKSLTTDDVFFFPNSPLIDSYRFSIQLPPIHSSKSPNSPKSKSLGSPITPSDSFSLSDIFNSIHYKNSSTDQVRINKDQKEIHINLLKQFWFESCVTFQVFFNMLLAPIKNKEWINEADFLRSVEATYQKSVWRPFVAEKEDHKFSEGIKIQQFLFFFCIVKYEFGEMNIEALCHVVRLARRIGKGKEGEAVQMAWKILSIANKNRKVVKAGIDFKEFFCVLLNKLRN